MPKNTKKRQCPNPCWMDTHQTNAINVLYVKKIHQNILETLWQWKTTLQPYLRNKRFLKVQKPWQNKQKERGETHAKNTQSAGRSRYRSSKAKRVTATLQEPKPTHQKRKKEEKPNTQNPHQEPCRKGAYEHMVHSRKYQIGCTLNTCIQKL